jgi:putative membrane protein
MDLADNLKLAVVQGFDKDSKEALSRIGRLQGAAFDREYMQQQVKAHERAVDLFERRGKATTNSKVKTFINDTLPELRKQLKEAREVAAKVTGSR